MKENPKSAEERIQQAVESRFISKKKKREKRLKKQRDGAKRHWGLGWLGEIVQVIEEGGPSS